MHQVKLVTHLEEAVGITLPEEEGRVVHLVAEARSK